MPTKSEKEIIRSVNLDGKTFGPGQEDELEQAFNDYGEKEEAADRTYDHAKNIERLTKQGAIVGFGANVKEDEIEEGGGDRAATRKRNPHLLQEPEPLRRGGKGAPTMEEVQMAPDSNVVEMIAAGGAKKHAASSEDGKAQAEKMVAATAQATEERIEASVQQESEQVPAPVEAPKGAARKGTSKSKK